MVIYIEIESTARELHYKIMLATCLANLGHRVIVAQSDILRRIYRKGKGGVYFGKNIFTRPAKEESGKFLLEQRDLGIKTVYLDEEGAVMGGSADDWKSKTQMRYNRSFFKSNDIVLYWGDYWKNQDGDNVKGRKITVGAPSFDLFKSDYDELFDVDKSTKNTNILVNGNFSCLFAANGLDTLEVIDAAKNIEDKSLILNIISEEANSYSSLLKFMLSFESKYKKDNINFVYRPHPGESYALTKQILHDYDNIKVENKTPLELMIRQADFVVHDGCTTGIQAYIAQKKVVAFQNSEVPRIYIPNAISNVARNIGDVERFIVDDEFFLPKGVISDYPPLESLINNIEPSSKQAILKIVDIIDDVCGTINKRNYREPTNWDVIQVDALSEIAIKIKKKTLYKIDHKRAHRFEHDHRRWNWDKNYIKSYQKKCSEYITSSASISYIGNWSLIIE